MGVSAVAGCASTQTSVAGPAARPVTARAGTILSLRAVTARNGDPAPWRAVLLADARAPNAAIDGSGSAGAVPVTEFIVRTDDGAIISVVQANVAGLRAGDRVVISQDMPTHLAREN
jgi:outer membrane lipoprotein SlyB